ncbi:MAG: hypothetical protein PCFJNLEI_02716 [Verrucomicrobiae bacterium]|nr:hypothetical protein [Verrucomicrobiae bacterium]
MFDERNEAVFRFVRMWRQKVTLIVLEQLTGISDATFHLWEHRQRGVTLVHVAKLARGLRCSDKVILGYEPCTGKCPQCRLVQS